MVDKSKNFQNLINICRNPEKSLSKERKKNISFDLFEER